MLPMEAKPDTGPSVPVGRLLLGCLLVFAAAALVGVLSGYANWILPLVTVPLVLTLGLEWSSLLGLPDTRRRKWRRMLLVVQLPMVAGLGGAATDSVLDTRLVGLFMFIAFMVAFTLSALQVRRSGWTRAAVAALLLLLLNTVVGIWAGGLLIPGITGVIQD